MKFTYQEAMQLDGRNVRIKRDGFWIPMGTILKVRMISFDYMYVGVKEESSYSLEYSYATTYGYFDKGDMGNTIELA